MHFLSIPSAEKPVKAYSLNVIIATGCCVKSLLDTWLRVWTRGAFVLINMDSGTIVRIEAFGAVPEKHG